MDLNWLTVKGVQFMVRQLQGRNIMVKRHRRAKLISSLQLGSKETSGEAKGVFIMQRCALQP